MSLRIHLTAPLLIFLLFIVMLPAGWASAQPTPPPSEADAYNFSNEGIFGCNQIAGAGASAGTMAAIGGVYVPVNDAAVTLNTGILVYKECILRPLQNRLKESATSALLKKQYIGIQTGRGGNPQYISNTNIGLELQPVDDKTALAYLTGPALETVHPAFREQIKKALAVNFMAETRGTGKPDCTYQTGVPFSLQNFEKLSDPSCNPYFAYLQEKDRLDAARAQALADCMTLLEWGRGYYPVTDGDQGCLGERVLTPPSVVQESFQQILGSPVRQLESANDIGQMIGALFAGVTTQALTSGSGLAGLAQSTAGGPSYLDQLAKESSQGVIGAAVNAALTILNSKRQIEVSYLAAMQAIVASLTDTVDRLRDTERACWNLIVPKAREAAAKGTCTVTDPNATPPTQTCTPFSLSEPKINTATSSLAFAQQLVDTQIKPLADIAATNVQASTRTLALIDQLIAGVTNTTSVTAQRLALEQLDALVAQGVLHTQYDVIRATEQRDSVLASMATLRTDTARYWGGDNDSGGNPNAAWNGTYPPQGEQDSFAWCNINNQNLPLQWAEKWKK